MNEFREDTITSSVTVMCAPHSLCLLIRSVLPKHTFPRCVCTHSSTVLVGIHNGGINIAGLVWHIQSLHSFTTSNQRMCILHSRNWSK